MKFQESIKICFQKYFDFTGRASRSEYWWFYLFTLLGGFCFGFIDGLFSIMPNSPIGLFGGIFSLALLLPGLAVFVRRLHDTNHSGWWYFLPLVPGVFFAIIGIMVRSISETSSALFFLVAALSVLGLSIVLLVWLCTDSDQGSNKYGPNPKEPADPQEGVSLTPLDV